MTLYTKAKYYIPKKLHNIFILISDFGHITWDFGQMTWGQIPSQIEVKCGQIMETCKNNSI